MLYFSCHHIILSTSNITSFLLNTNSYPFISLRLHLLALCHHLQNVCLNPGHPQCGNCRLDPKCPHPVNGLCSKGSAPSLALLGGCGTFMNWGWWEVLGHWGVPLKGTMEPHSLLLSFLLLSYEGTGIALPCSPAITWDPPTPCPCRLCCSQDPVLDVTAPSQGCS